MATPTGAAPWPDVQPLAVSYPRLLRLSGVVLDVSKLKYYAAGEFGQRVRYWDFAATEQKEGVDPDWTAGVLMGVEDGAYQVQDVQRF